MSRILNAEPDGYSADARETLRTLGDVVELRLSRQQLLQMIADFDVLIVRLGIRVDREVLDSATRLRFIVSATTGLDHIDVTYTESRGIAVLSLQSEKEFLRSIPATAEHTWALLLSLVRHIPKACASTIAGEWNRDAFRGHDLCGKRLGILGLGRVGEKVARYGVTFGMDVAAYDPHRADWLPDIVRCATLLQLLERSDVLSVHVPLNAETERMIGRAEIGHLPTGAWLLNTSRGGVLDEVALVEALESGKLSGAALDVLEEEYDKEGRINSPIMVYARQHDNLLITPHIGGATVESMARTEVFMAEKLRRHLARQDMV